MANPSITFSDVQNFERSGKFIYKSETDKVYSTYQLGDLSALPKSLFYDAATSDGAGYAGLFAYYVLGKGSGGKPAIYHLTETTDELITEETQETSTETTESTTETTSELTAEETQESSEVTEESSFSTLSDEETEPRGF
jgi:hypothetical protein